MKRILVWMLILMLLCGAAQAETRPDGTGYSAFRVSFDESLIKDWKTTMYLDAAGLLLSASTTDAELTVSVDESGVAQSAADFLRRHVNNVSRYGRVISYKGPYSWQNRWQVDGASIRYNYMYLNGANTDDEYETAIYVAPFSANYYIVISLNTWGVHAEERLRMFETEFVPSLNLGTQKVSTQFLAYLKDVRSAENGTLRAVLDFCTVEYDMSILAVYTANDDPTEYTYTLRDDALLYLPANDALYSARQVSADEETLRRAIDDSYRLNDMYPVYQVLFNENNEIVWMMHYNAL